LATIRLRSISSDFFAVNLSIVYTIIISIGRHHVLSPPGMTSRTP
jgi:hypothetical protein